MKQKHRKKTAFMFIGQPILFIGQTIKLLQQNSIGQPVT